MSRSPYYLAYEKRYQTVYSAGASRWGHSPDDADLVSTLSEWVAVNNLTGKRVIEYACGEGAAGVILASLGCIYHGVDIAPSAVDKAKEALAGFPSASVTLLDMVNERIQGLYDAALDVMGIHMLITDEDRLRYLLNAYSSLENNAPMLFYKESYREDADEGIIESFDDWLRISNSDYHTPQLRRVLDSDICVNIPLVPARARTKSGCISEIQKVGFRCDEFRVMEPNEQNPFSASIWAHK